MATISTLNGTLNRPSRLGPFRHLDTFEPRGEGALQAYLRQAIINRIRNELRRANNRPMAEGLDSGFPDHATSPIEAAIARETIERYEAGLATLQPDERDAVVTRVEFGFSFAEVAEALGKASPDAARMTVARALVKLARVMRLPAMNTSGGGCSVSACRVFSNGRWAELHPLTQRPVR